MSGAELYEHLRDDGAGASLGATLAVISFVLTVSSLVWLWERRRNRRRLDPEAARLRAALRREGYRMYGPDDHEWNEFTRSHRLRRPDRVDRLVDDALYGDGLTRDYRWP
jgi:hypothetical protein